jgi:proteasome lid subunit RPN8/RPN11
MLETLLHKGDEVERCGLILKDGSTVELPNIAENPETSFRMDLEKALPYLTDDQVAATWHTHPHTDPNLSGEDYSCFLSWPDLEHVIVGIRDGDVAVTRYRVEKGLVIACD